MYPRIYTEFWVQAHIQRCTLDNIPAMVVARGDAERGGILLKINRFSEGVTLLQPTTDMDGSRVWVCISGDAALAEKDADAVIAKRRGLDTDLWVIEVEDLHGNYQLGEPIQKE